LEDGTQVEADFILLATGFWTDFSYLSDKITKVIRYDPDNQLHPLFFTGQFSLELLKSTVLRLQGGLHPGRYELPSEKQLGLLLEP
jgi:hypothetical protein